MPSRSTWTCEAAKPRRSGAHARIVVKKISVKEIHSPKLVDRTDGVITQASLPIVPDDLIHLIILLRPVILVLDPDEPNKYRAVGDTSPVQWLIDDPIVRDIVGETITAIVIEESDWNHIQLDVMAEWLVPYAYGELGARDKRACHRALRQAGLPIPQEPVLSELMRRGRTSPKAKHGK